MKLAVTVRPDAPVLPNRFPAVGHLDFIERDADHLERLVVLIGRRALNPAEWFKVDL